MPETSKNTDWTAENVKILRELAGKLRQDELADRAGVPVSTLQKLLSGKVEPRFSTLAAVMDALGSPIDVLLTGRRIYDWSEDQQPFHIPSLRDLKVSAGDGSVAYSESLDEGPFAFTESWLRNRFGQISELRMIQVTGDSQEPDLFDGDWVMVDQSRTQVHNGLHVLVLDDTLMLKRLQLEGRFIQLLSRNPAYAGIAIDLTRDSERIKIVGKAVASFKHMG